MKKIDSDLKKIVLAKIENYDDDYLISVGGCGTYGKEAMIKEVEKETEVGIKIADIQRVFMEDLANGEFYKILNESL